MMNLGRLAFLVGLVAAAGAAGCFVDEEETSSGNDQVNEGGDVSAVLKSTLVLDTGCTAAKVGPRQLLVAARCVASKPEVVAGATIRFKLAGAADAPATADTATTKAPSSTTVKADAAAPDASTAKVTDAGAKTATNPSMREATIAAVEIHASYAANCKGDMCAFETLAASEAKDIAVIVLDADLASVPTIPVDLDSVGQGDSLLAVGSGCATLDGKGSGLKTTKTIAVPAKSVNHEGSPYIQEPELITRLGGGYVVTAGTAWRKNGAKLCSSDIGAPLFRAGQAAVAGVTSNYTTWGESKLVPVTVHHTRVDSASKVGPWLASLGVQTIHSCSEATGGCVKKDYDGGVPTHAASVVAPGDDAGDELIADAGDAGEEADAGEVDTSLPAEGEESALPSSSDDDSERTSSPDDYDASPRKKKKKQAAGCSAAPGEAPVGSGALIGFGIAVAAGLSRRRRAG